MSEIAGVAPNTANRALRALQERRLVDSRKVGRATLWTTTADVAGLTELEGSTQDRVALVVTGVDLEHTEVRNRLVNVERIRVGGIYMLRGEVPGARTDWNVYLARAGMGNATSAALVGLAAGELRANLVAFVGTAAGLKPGDQQHLDVVVASSIHNPYAGKQVPTDSGSVLLGRDKSYVVPAPLVSVVTACIADSAWTSSTRSPHYDPRHPHAFVAPIVAVDAVQTDPDGPVMQEIRARFQDAAALDMESFGLAAGSDIHDLPVLVIRGISDFIGDKSAAGNDDQQPLAAGHAASLLRDILVFADPDDVKRGAAVVPPEPTDYPGHAPEVVLPCAIQMWMDRLARRSDARAEAAREALAEMRRSGGTAATWLSRALHRPPAWLREDDTGDGWALVGSLASWSGSKVAWRAFEQAARSATLTGDLDASAYFTMTARLERIAKDTDANEAVGPTEPGPSALDDFDDDVLDRLRPVIDVYRAVLEHDLAKAKACTEIALACLGFSDQSGVLSLPTEAVDVIEFDSELRDLVAATVLRQLAQLMLAPGAADQLGITSGLAAPTLRGNPVTRDLADDAMHLAQWAVALRPDAEGTRLTLAQTTLAVLVSMAGRTAADVGVHVARYARTVETDAMVVRDALRDWDGTSGSALAVAARARSIQGDFNGALRMLQPAPDGIASQQEARHPEVIRLGAHLAQVVGDDDLALALAAKNPNEVEAQLMRAAVLGANPEMAGESKDALFAALALSRGDHHDDYLALMALARRFNSLNETEQATVTAHIEKIGELDPALAGVMRARVLISQGDTSGALRHVRGMERSELVLEAHADALVASNRAKEATLLVLEEGKSRGDVLLVTEALDLAMDNGLSEIGRNIALDLLGNQDGKSLRLKALHALQQIALSESNWSEVAARTQELIRELHDNDLPVPEIQYWQLAEALFFQEKFEKALDVLLDSPPLSFAQRERAQLFLTLIWRVTNEQRARANGQTDATRTGLGNPRLYAIFMRAAAEWAHDEQIATAAMSVVLTAPDSSFTEAQVAELRGYTRRYFEQHGDNASITRLPVERDNLEPLKEYMRAGDAGQRALEELAGEVRSGRFPLAVLTEAAGCTTTESLIRRDLGYVMAVDDDGGVGEQTARKALDGRVVVDVTALVVARWTGQTFKKLAASFDAVIVPATLRADVARARTGLAMKSTATLRWDTRSQNLTFSTTSAEEAQAYADTAEQIWADAQRLQVAPVAEATPHGRWLSAITAAQELGVPVWADDVTIRRFARSMGVPAFGSIDLVRALDNDAHLAAAITAFRDNKVVDLPIDQPWDRLAEQAEWKVDSPFALAISRPAAWRDIPEAFAQFRSLVTGRPRDIDPETTAAWAHLAANGLAMATVPSARPTVVSAFLAWTISFADPFFTAVHERPHTLDDANVPPDGGRVAELIFTAADALRDHHYPAADGLTKLVDVLFGGLLKSVGPQATSRIVAALANRLDQETGRRVFAAYIQSAGT
ncbi:PIN domain-containing protein [Mycobacterium sp. M23085]|uniref:5'-methylthioadenosine/S-adenosylhomocysteine nucleosidase family protein n=1 Tax=Mycobacterium sp. M23085 TaxID=3378087 RepID=UPI0038780DC5